MMMNCQYLAFKTLYIILWKNYKMNLLLADFFGEKKLTSDWMKGYHMF